MVRKAAPLRGKHSVGDLVEFKRVQGAKTEDAKWSPATGTIGFDGDNVIWELCNGVPVCVATDKVRPCTPEKTLAFLYLNQQSMHDYIPARPDQQQEFVNVAQAEVDEHAQETVLLGRDDQDNQATGVKRE